MILVYIISGILGPLETKSSFLLWAKAFQQTTRIWSHLSSKVDNDPEDVPSAQSCLSVQCSWPLLPPAIWDEEGGEPGYGTEATPYPGKKLVLGSSVQGGCAVFHLLKTTTVVRKWKKKKKKSRPKYRKNVGEIWEKPFIAMLEVSVWRQRAKDTINFHKKEWHEEALADTPQWFKEAEK